MRTYKDSTIKVDISMARFTKIQRVYLKLNPKYKYINQYEIEFSHSCKEIDLMASELLIKISEYYK